MRYICFILILLVVFCLFEGIKAQDNSNIIKTYIPARPKRQTDVLALKCDPIPTDTGNPYPTHGLDLICQIMNIHRGDKINFIVSLSTNQFGLTESSKEKYGADSSHAKQNYKMGDMNVSLIRTEKGRLITVQHDITSSRMHLVSGTKGYAQRWTVEQMALKPNAHEAMSKAAMDSLLALYEHPFSKGIGEQTKKIGGHGGMDFIMNYRLVYCLQSGLRSMWMYTTPWSSQAWFI